MAADAELTPRRARRRRRDHAPQHPRARDLRARQRPGPAGARAYYDAAASPSARARRRLPAPRHRGPAPAAVQAVRRARGRAVRAARSCRCRAAQPAGPRTRPATPLDELAELGAALRDAARAPRALPRPRAPERPTPAEASLARRVGGGTVERRESAWSSLGVRVELPANTPVRAAPRAGGRRSGCCRSSSAGPRPPPSTARSRASCRPGRSPTTCSQRARTSSAPRWSGWSSPRCGSTRSTPSCTSPRRRGPRRVEPPVRRHRARRAHRARRSSPTEAVLDEAGRSSAGRRRRGRGRRRGSDHRRVPRLPRRHHARRLRRLSSSTRRAPDSARRSLTAARVGATVRPRAHRRSYTCAQVTTPPMTPALERSPADARRDRGSPRRTVEQSASAAPRPPRSSASPYRQLDYWARTDLVRPSLADAAGSGSRRAYCYRDLLELRVIKSLLDAGIKLESVREVFEYLREHVGDRHRLRPPRHQRQRRGAVRRRPARST